MNYFDKIAEDKAAEDIEIAQEIANTDLPTDTKIEILEEQGVDPEVIEEVVNADAVDTVAAYYGVDPYWLSDKVAASRARKTADEAGGKASKAMIWLKGKGADAQNWLSDENNRNAVLGGGIGGLAGAGLGYAMDGTTGALMGGAMGAGLGGLAGYNYLDDSQLAGTAAAAGLGGLAGAGLGYMNGGPLGAFTGGLTGVGLGGLAGYYAPDYSKFSAYDLPDYFDILSAAGYNAAGDPIMTGNLMGTGEPGRKDTAFNTLKKRDDEDEEDEILDSPLYTTEERLASYTGSAWLDDKLAGLFTKKESEEEKKKRQTNQGLAGAGVGGLVGTGLGAAVGGSKGAAIGGALGAGLGGAGGYHLDAIKEKAQGWLDKLNKKK